MQRWHNREQLIYQVVVLQRDGLSRRAIAHALGTSCRMVMKILLRHAEARQQPHSLQDKADATLA